MPGENEEETTFATTPTWAVATVCFVLIAVSILLEHLLHILAESFEKRKRKALLQALDKIKSELMLLGFISLFLHVCERPISNICVPRSASRSFLPCKSHNFEGPEEEGKCEKEGKVSLISRKGVQQLQLLMFVLAVSHVVSCFLTFSLGMVKMSAWKSWEGETRTREYQFSNDPRRFQLTHQTSFGRRHLRFWSGHRFLRLPASFCRQFYNSVSRADYMILRHGFIMARFGEGSTFDFQKYLEKALEKDFGLVVGVSPWIWLFSILFIFFSADTFRDSLWLPFFPTVMLLVVGTKLQGIITKMCLDSNDKSLVVRGTLLVRPSDHFFWFGRPELLLHLIHFVLVQNSFQLAFFVWTWQKFGLRSCFHPNAEDIVSKIATGLLVQLICGYVTLPLYALVTQMGSSMRKTHVLPGRVIGGLRRWKNRARKNIARSKNARLARPSLDASLASSFSFSTLDGSLLLELDEDSIVNGEFVEINVLDQTGTD